MATATEAASNTPARRKDSNGNGARGKEREQQLDEQIAQLQNDLKGIADTLAKLTGEKVDEARALARSEAKNLQHQAQSVIGEVQHQAQHVMEEVQDQASAMEKQLKDTIREKPLTAVASAVGIGFLLALLTRR